MRDINLKVEDGNLGRGSSDGTGIQVKIGLSNVTSTELIKVTRSMTAAKIKEALGQTPLADACIDSVENGAETIYCIPVKESDAGAVKDPVADAQGKGTFKASGSPHNAYDIVVEITETGGQNDGAFRYSLDGGRTYGEEQTIPVDGQFEIPDTGVSLTFTDAVEETSFEEGDTYTFVTTGPSMSNEDILTAVKRLLRVNLEFEFVHIVGMTTNALWASLATLANSFLEDAKHPIYFVCEARAANNEEPIADYVAALKESLKGINSRYLQVVAAWGRYLRMDGREQDINLAGVVTGLYGLARASQSIGEVRSFPILSSKLLRLLPEGIEEYLDDLDGSRFLTFRQYVGLDDYYVYNARMVSAEGSDFRYAEETRVMNYIVNEIRKKATEELQTEIDPGALDVSLAVIQERLKAPVEEAVRQKIISSGDVVINTEGLNILVDETLEVRVSYVPMGHVRQIDITFGVENPYAG